MLRFFVTGILTICIFSSNCRTASIARQKPFLCMEDNYVMSLFSERILRMTFNRTRLKQLNVHTIHVRTSIEDRKAAEFEGHQHTIDKSFQLINSTEQLTNQPLIIYNIKIHAKYMNQTFIHYSIQTINLDNTVHRINCSNVLLISQPQRILDTIFKRAIPFIIIFVSIQMGMLLDTKVLKELIRRPIQIAIGFVCQYGFMPLIAFAITKAFRYPPIYGLGLFVVGCCPGDLSSFMSFSSTIASFFMMPLWLYTLGQYGYLRQLKIHIPFSNLAISLLTIIGPLGIGMLIVYFVPKLKPLIKRIVKPMLIVMIFYFFVFGAIVNFYLVHYIDLKTALTTPLLPWFGFALGGVFARICKQDWKRSMTIGIETGIQNIGIAIMILLYSLPPPANSQATAIPIIVAYLSPQPFYVVLIYQLIRKRFCKPKKASVRQVSVDTLSKTTHHLSESEGEPLADISSPKPPVPLSILGNSPDPSPPEIK